jgi:hypothetical protein
MTAAAAARATIGVAVVREDRHGDDDGAHKAPLGSQRGVAHLAAIERASAGVVRFVR